MAEKPHRAEEETPYLRNLVLMMVTQMMVCIYQVNMHPFYIRNASEKEFDVYGIGLQNLI